MTIGKMKPVATIVAQFAAGVEVEAIQHDGKVFLPVIGLGEFATKDDAPAHHTPTTAAPTSKNEDKGDDATTSKVYTEDELMDTDTKELMRICKDEFGIDHGVFNIFTSVVGNDMSNYLTAGITSCLHGHNYSDTDELQDVPFFYPITGVIRYNLLKNLCNDVISRANN